MLLNDNPNSIPLLETSASYYNNVSKRWKYGIFIVNKNCFQFTENNANDNEQFHLSLPYNAISTVEKQQSSLFFASIVVTVGSEKHWFASFLNRDSVFNLLELFWRAVLLGKPNRTSESSQQSIIPRTSIGKDLLNLLHDSENTLIEAANSLAEQSQQLHDARENIEALNNDLSVAEEMVKRMKVLPMLVGGMVANVQNVIKKTKEQSVLKERRFGVTFSLLKSNKGKCWDKGTLVVADRITILGENQVLRLAISIDELEYFKVLSPWQLQIHYITNNLQQYCEVMCPQLSSFLKFISNTSDFKEKDILHEENSSVYSTPCSSASSMVSAPGTPASPSTPTALPEDSSQTQVYDQDLISEEELSQIGTILGNLQKLAMEVGMEQQSQLEQIHALVAEFEKTTVRMKIDAKELRKL